MNSVRNPGSSSTRQSLFLRLKTDAPAAEIAWHEFHARYGPIIGAFARKIGARPQDIGDVVQDVLLGFFKRAPEFEYNPAKGRFRSYLKTCTFHAIKRMGRKNWKIGAVPIDEIDPADPRVEAAWDRVWETEKLHCALEAVRARYSESDASAKTFAAFEMCVILQRQPKDVAEELGIKVDSVYAAKSRVSRALAHAVKHLESERT